MSTDDINVTGIPAEVITPSFTWSPSTTTTLPSGVVVNRAAHGVSLTFTASLVTEDASGRLTVIEYRWDFGDGVFGYGNGATHTYKLANFSAATILRVTDSRNHQWFTRQQMYLS